MLYSLTYLSLNRFISVFAVEYHGYAKTTKAVSEMKNKLNIVTS